MIVWLASKVLDFISDFLTPIVVFIAVLLAAQYFGVINLGGLLPGPLEMIRGILTLTGGVVV